MSSDPMPHTRRIVQNILSNWTALFITTAAAFFVSPYVVHHLGNLAYGVWVLVASMVSYMNLLDLGLRSAVTRFVSKGVAQQDREAANKAVSGALWIRFWISVAIILIGTILGLGFRHIFKIPGQLAEPARITLLITSVSIAISLWCGVFGGVLAALHRFDVISSVSILQTCLRAVGFVVLLHGGRGIVALAAWELCTSVLANLATTISCFRIYPDLRLTFRPPDSTTFGRLWNYSLYVFVINIAVQVVYYSDNMVVGAFLSPTAVTFYAIGGTLVLYSRQIVSAMTTTFAPLASTYEAEGKQSNLRGLLIHGTRAALLVSLPIEAALFFRGHTFIRLWMGEQYAQPSGTVMQILLLSVLFSTANTTSNGIVWGMEKHKRVALWAMCEAMANLTLSIILVRKIGIYGVALGTAIPSILIELILWPSYICKLVMMPVRTYLWQTWARTMLGAVPFAVTCAATDYLWKPQNLATFFAQVLALLPLLFAAYALIFRDEIATQVRFWYRRRKSLSGIKNEYQSSATTLG
jgi:O-antigen/teichoic acid export membrane protein